MSAETLFKLALLTAALVPLTMVNLRTRKIPMGYNLFLFALGLSWMAASWAMGWTKTSLPHGLITVVAEAAVIYVLLAALKAPGGVGKAIVALTPWFGASTLAAIVLVAMAYIFVVAKATGRSDVLFGPPLLAASVAAVLV